MSMAFFDMLNEIRLNNYAKLSKQDLGISSHDVFRDCTRELNKDIKFVFGFRLRSEV